MVKCLVLAIYCLGVAGAARAEGPCPKGAHEAILLHSQKLEEIELIRVFWAPSRFTDPTKHDPLNYRYIIRVDNVRDVPYGMDRVAAEADWARKMHRNYPLVSASVIAPGQTGTFMGRNWAYILKVPESNVLASTPKDSGIASMASQRRGDPKKMAASLGPYYGMHEPGHLVDSTIVYTAANKGAKDDYNEVFLMGETDGGRKIEVVGIAYFPGRRGSYGEVTDRGFLERVARNLGVPIVDIP